MDTDRHHNLYIHADNVHTGGGKILLESLIASNFAKTCRLQLDVRMNLSTCQPGQKLRLVDCTVLDRLVAQYWLKKNIQVMDTLLCFGNLPPLFEIKGRVVVFLQNRFLIEKVRYKELSIKLFFRLFVERLWFKHFLKNADQIIVQTQSMKLCLDEYLSQLSNSQIKNIKVSIAPFTSHYVPDEVACPGGIGMDAMEFDFIYPASGEAHKNHKNLVNALIILAKENIYPSIIFTLDEKKFQKIMVYVNKAKIEHNLNIHNRGFLAHQEVLKLYKITQCVIFPSFNESFGLPLIEAKKIGLSVVAAELDYVRDSISPENTFDPKSAISISRAIKRQMGIKDRPMKILDVDDFFSILNSSEINSL
jgi:hypothetical protein